MTRKKKDSGSQLIAIDRKNKQGSEQFRAIRSNLNFFSVNKNLKTLAVSSPSSGDGKTMTASNLAIVFRQEGKEVLLVDTDLRKPSIHQTFDVPNNYGLSHHLLGEMKVEDIITTSYLTSVDIITSGLIPPNPSEMLSSPQMTEFIETVKEMYDIVIFDTPPILVVTDATIVANKCDGALLVVRHKKNELSQVERARDQLKNADAHLIGAVFNGPKVPKEAYYY
ncbi:CpsD/CapB family tyrosine-protein kinase [Filobacillus milosensis]|uniref:CpsD/CapB family tyrosine-protein kinase n=1 Tax=Filobacillus milosensis TaxID=94137 RepID=UPI001E589019|nr:CpsD/CapB family tyrosine-protein kinase [Filobacillus milosensis]